MSENKPNGNEGAGVNPASEEAGVRGNGAEQSTTQPHEPPPEAPPATKDEPAEPAPEAAPEEKAEPAPDEQEQGLAQARQEAKTQYDKFLRVSAEFENYKKRVQKEHAERLRYAMTPMVREIAAIVDNLELAVSHAKNGQDDGGKALLDGIEMVVRQIHEAFAKLGVTRIETKGKPFDPELHEAMTMVETGELPENHVCDEFQSGYQLHDRVVRPARVSVSKRPPAPAGDEPTEQ